MTDLDLLLETITTLVTRQQPPEATLNQVVEQVGKTLKADRCFLYIRQPDQQHGRIAFCWRKNDHIPDVIQPDWQTDTTELPQEDPLFRAAITLQPSVYVDDVETASSTVLNQEFERKRFGHRALVHAHITRERQLWGILQPCLFGQPRHWTQQEKTQIEAILPLLQPVIAAYVKAG